MSATRLYDRRGFLKGTAAAGGGLVIAFHLPGCGAAENPESSRVVFEPNAWLKVAANGEVGIVVDRAEMGQGVLTSLPMIVAEELDADWRRVRLEATPDRPDAWTRGMLTGGSASVATSWEPLRQAGAAARAMLVAAAAAEWGVPAEACETEAGAVLHRASGRRVEYGAVAEKAAALPVPEAPPLKDPSTFRLVGTPVPRLDTPEKVDGSATFGIDVKLPGMLVAVVERSPVFGGSVAAVDDAAARAVPGVRDVVRMERAVAVVADGYWPATQGRRALRVTWNEGAGAGVGDAEIAALFRRLADGPGVVHRQDGDAAAALRGATVLAAEYEVPFLAHATMEPMNCTADVRADGCDVYGGFQAQSMVQPVVAEALGLEPAQVRVHTTLLGGGFGRRAETDFATEAVAISKAVGAPVKVVWSREDDTRHCFYRPAGYHRFRAALGADGLPVAWHHRLVTPSVLSRWMPQAVQEGRDGEMVSGAADLPYGIPNVHVEATIAETHVPVGWWRSVAHSQNAFVTEAFLDELAAAAGRDPYEYRRALLADRPRDRAVLDLAAERSGWGAALPAGRARGIAYHHSFGTRVAEVAEVSLQGGAPRVHRVVCAVDCGIAVNPDTIAAQMESAVAYGLSAVLRGRISIENGRVREGNFDTYPVVRMPEAPVVETYVVPSGEPPSGVGEPGLPPLAAAVAGALWALDGQRRRRLPVT